MALDDNSGSSKKGLPIKTSPLILDDPPPPKAGSHLEEAKAGYLAILRDLDWDLGQEYLPRAEEVRLRLEKAADKEQFKEAAGMVREKLNAFVRLMMAEREESSQFILEIVRRLSEVEAHLKSTASGATAIYKESEGFATNMIGDIREIHVGTTNCTNLSEVKELVLAGLDHFKAALESHRDQQRRHIKTVSIELDQMRNRFNQVQDQLSRMEEENQSLVCRLREDPLTGAQNRLALEERIYYEIGLTSGGRQGFSILMIDLDRFKRINDSYGHAIGDNCLVEVVAKLKSGLEKEDMLARYGGEEFVVILPGSSPEEARARAEKMRKLVADTDFTVKGRRIPVTVSIGVTDCRPTDKTPKELFTRVDEALYGAKNSGRNRVQVL